MTDQDRMSDVEALMWTLETDPHLSSTFANLTIFDKPPDIERLRRRLWRATRVVPRLRRRVAPSMGPLAPAWEDDPEFDLDRHMRQVTLPQGATIADVRALAVELARSPLDRERPLWEFTLIEGLPDGQAAMVQKMHHTITDGEGGIRLSVEFIDLEPDAPEPDPVDDGPPPPPADRTTGWTGALDTVTGAARWVVDSAVDVVRNPGDTASLIAGLPAESAATARSVIRQLAVVDGHRSPIWAERSLDRHLHTFDVSLADVKAAATALGGSVNDLFVAAAAGGAGAHHRRHGSDVAELRMSMPVSTRTDRSAGGNSFTPTRVLVPLDEDPRRRFEAIHERLSVTKTEKALGLVSALAGAMNLLPRPVLVRLARQQVETVDFATSNLRAAPFPLYIAGARIVGNYPVGPIAGTAWNLTTMSYDGRLDIGLHVDAAAVPDHEGLRDDIVAAFDELVALRAD